VSDPNNRRQTAVRPRLRAKRRAIRASDLAKMTVCEQKLVFEKRYGERLTRAQEERIRDGDRGHARFLRQAFVVNPDVRSSESKAWCFIATELWGEHAAETCALRALRDAILRRYVLGRAFTRVYYRISPAVAAYLARHPRVRRLAKAALTPVVAAAEYALRKTR
jgi:hypothetical protein